MGFYLWEEYEKQLQALHIRPVDSVLEEYITKRCSNLDTLREYLKVGSSAEYPDFTSFLKEVDRFIIDGHDNAKNVPNFFNVKFDSENYTKFYSKNSKEIISYIQSKAENYGVNCGSVDEYLRLNGLECPKYNDDLFLALFTYQISDLQVKHALTNAYVREKSKEITLVATKIAENDFNDLIKLCKEENSKIKNPYESLDQAISMHRRMFS